MRHIRRVKNDILEFFDRTDLNTVNSQRALTPEAVGLRIYDAPLVGVAAAADPLFDSFLDPAVIGPHFLPPSAWLPDARSVVSIFLPYTRAVCEANRPDIARPAAAWLHARIDGQTCMDALMHHLCDRLTARGHRCVVPVLDARFGQVQLPDPQDPVHRPCPSSNWSERHIAYACGLGTFGLTRGLITARGTAGRFCSFVTDLAFAPSERPYSDPYAYCTGCGACARRCPVHAIDPATGKSNTACGDFLDETKKLYPGYYGCGKCQLAVPCETRNPTAAGDKSSIR